MESRNEGEEGKDVGRGGTEGSLESKHFHFMLLKHEGDRWELSVKYRKLSCVLCDDLEGWDGGGGGREAHEGWDICIHIAD